jgi:prophage regulatory protein
LSATAWWRGVKSGKFPQPIKQGNSTLWKVSQIRALVDRLGVAPGERDA